MLKYLLLISLKLFLAPKILNLLFQSNNLKIKKLLFLMIKKEYKDHKLKISFKFKKYKNFILISIKLCYHL